jgi:Glu-tRNA(Gln) amidotransferase subunit E-like FAD-binding protein
MKIMKKLKVGLEIHQRLKTGKKLFCDCSDSFSQTEPCTEISRKLRAVPGQMGEIDPAALHEFLKDKTFRYLIYPEETCSVELDEEPPHPLNREALEIALQVAKMLDMEIPEEIHMMRKTVIDGSNTSGFQRTALIGLNGKLETSFGTVGITNLCLEEESAQIISQDKNSTTYGLNRLGIPLIEIGTAPDMKSPGQAREVAEKLGMLLRSTGKVQRGIGSIRQDVNISIGSGRVEIKGFQDIRTIEKVINLEIKRQQKLLKTKGKVPEETRKVNPDSTTTYTRPLPGEARMYPETDIPPIHISKEEIKAIKLPETLEEKKKKFIKLGLSPHLSQEIIKSKFLDLFEELIQTTKISTTLIADTLATTLKELKRKENVMIEKIKEDHLRDLFKFYQDGKIAKETIPEILKEIPSGKDIKEIIKKLKTLSLKDLEKIIDKEIQKNKKMIKEEGDRAFKKLMGPIMKQARGKISGELVAKKLKEKLDKFFK